MDLSKDFSASAVIAGQHVDAISIIDCSEIREGKLNDLKAAISELVEFVRTTEPKTIAYEIYFNEDQIQTTVLQIHPDSASAEFHMEVASRAFRKFVELINMSRIDIYATPSQVFWTECDSKLSCWAARH